MTADSAEKTAACTLGIPSGRKSPPGMNLLSMTEYMTSFNNWQTSPAIIGTRNISLYNICLIISGGPIYHQAEKEFEITVIAESSRLLHSSFYKTCGRLTG